MTYYPVTFQIHVFMWVDGAQQLFRRLCTNFSAFTLECCVCFLLNSSNYTLFFFHLIMQSPHPAPKKKKLVWTKVEIQTTDMAEVRSGPALIDSSVTSLFMDQRYAKHHRLTALLGNSTAQSQSITFMAYQMKQVPSLWLLMPSYI